MIIVGLGNPGKKYEKTYHNMGYQTVTKLAELMGLEIKEKECSALTASKFVDGERVVLALPTTFMNLSGEAVALLKGRYKAENEDIVVVYDDIDIPSGVGRARYNGSAGSHNGMKSIVGAIGQDFKRIRIGVGKPPENVPLIDFVLMNVIKEDSERISDLQDRAAKEIMTYVKDKDFDRLMRSFNG